MNSAPLRYAANKEMMVVIHNKFRHLPGMMLNEWRSPEALRHIQESKLRRLLDHAYRHISMYRELWQAAGIHPSDIHTVADLRKLPVVDKRDFHRRDPGEVIDRRIRRHEALLTLRTSGSSGITLAFGVDSAYDQFRKAQFLRPYLTNGQGIGDKVLWFRARPVTTRQWFHKLGIMREHQILASEAPDIQRQILMQVRPTILRGYGSAISLLARHLLEDGIAPPPIKVVFTDSEVLPPPMRRIIERSFKAPVIDIFGTFETENIAYECRRHKGYHITSDCVVVEFLRNGDPVAPGEAGEIVCTVLDNLTTPFIRYNLHDMAVLHTESCPCGRSFPLMSHIVGRSHDYISTAAGRQVSTTSIAGILWPLTHYFFQFQIVQQRKNLFCVRIVPTRHYAPEIDRRIIATLRQVLSGADVRVETVSQIERETSGKFFQFKSQFETSPDS